MTLTFYALDIIIYNCLLQCSDWCFFKLSHIGHHVGRRQQPLRCDVFSEPMPYRNLPTISTSITMVTNTILWYICSQSDYQMGHCRKRILLSLYKSTEQNIELLEVTCYVYILSHELISLIIRLYKFLPNVDTQIPVAYLPRWNVLWIYLNQFGPHCPIVNNHNFYHKLRLHNSLPTSTKKALA